MKNKLKKLTSALLVAAMAVSMASCSAKETPVTENPSAPAISPSGTGSAEPAASESPSTGGESVSSKDTITIALDREPASLDPVTNSVNVKRMIERNIYDTLLVFDLDMNATPSLAETWEQVDELTWKFNLRKGVKFHNGDELTSKDVLFSINRMFDSTVSNDVEALDPAGLEAPDDYTVIIRTKAPYSLLESLLCSPATSILPEKVVTEKGNDAFSREPVGSGAFKFVSWTAGDNITLERNDEYWGEKAVLKTVICRIITESASRTIDLESGGIDIVLLLAENDCQRIDENPETQLITHTNMTLRYIAFNTQKDLFKDKLVRQALYHATDTETLRVILYGADTSVLPTTPVPPGLPGRNENLVPYEFNVDKAKELLSQAGMSDGFTVEFMYLANSTNNMLAELLQEMWKQINVTLVLKPTESGALTTSLNKGEQELCSAGTAFGLGDAGDGLFKFFHTSSMYSSSARTNLSDPAVDEIIDKIIVTTNVEERNGYIMQAQEMIHELAPMIYIANPLSTVGARSDVRGLLPEKTNLYDFRLLHFVEE